MTGTVAIAEISPCVRIPDVPGNGKERQTTTVQAKWFKRRLNTGMIK